MAFEIPEDLHPDLIPLAWLLGTWEGRGHGDYPTIESFHFGQQLIFAHDGRPFLHYFSRTWLLDDVGEKTRESALETGFLRPQPDGEVDGAKLELGTDVVARTKSAKEVTAGQRLYGLVEGDLLYAYDMAAMGESLQ